MGLVFPSGKGKNVTWLDRLNGTDEGKEIGEIKTASTERQEAREVIGTAALSLDELKRLAQLSNFEEKEDAGEEPEVDVDVDEALPAPAGESPMGPEVDVEISEESEGTSGDPVNEAADAVADAQQALDQAATALVDAGAECCEGEVEGEVEEGEFGGDSEEEIEIPIEIDKEGNVDFDKDEEEESTSVPGINPAMASSKKSTKTEKKATVEESSRFVKIAKLSAVNRKKLADYWITTFGYDKEWVGQMLQDYN